MVCFVKEFLDQLRIMSVIVVSIKESVTKVLFVIDVVLRLLRKRLEEKEWDTLL